MSVIFYIAGAVAIISGVMVVTRANAMYALIYLLILFLAIAVVFFALGAPFVALIEVIIYAGAIIVLFVFVVMMLNLGKEAEQQERSRLPSLGWLLPVVLSGALMVAFIMALPGRGTEQAGTSIGPKAVGISLYTTYFIGVELASLLLLAALVAAFRLGFLPSILEEKDE